MDEFRQWLQDNNFRLFQSGEPENWTGKIHIEWFDEEIGDYKAQNHNIMISLPAGFPFQTPFVVSIDTPPLDSSPHLNPEPIHSLCLWTPSSDWQPYFTAEKLLKRIQDWFSAYHTNSWPPTSEMPDLHLYLRQRGSVIVAEDWHPENTKEIGEFNLWHDPLFREHKPSIATTNLDFQNWDHENKFHSHLLINTREYKRTPGIWLKVDKAFVPPNNLSTLFDMLDNKRGYIFGQTFTEFKRRFGIKSSSAGLAIALGYQNTDQERWLFLWGRFPDSTKKNYKWSGNSELSRIRLESFRSAPARRRDLIRRSAYISANLENKHIVLFGVGSLGGTVALLLAKAGVTDLTLVDHDIMMPGNVIRHICGISYVGYEKNIVAKVVINQHNPYCNVVLKDTTWHPELLKQYIQTSDLVIDTTANKNFSLLLNDVCVTNNKAILFGAAFRRARIGRIISRMSAEDPCLACYNDPAQFWSSNNYPLIPPSQEEAFVEDGCGSVTEEATALDVEAVANFVARKALNILRQTDNLYNLGLLVNEPLPDTINSIFLQAGTHWIHNSAIPACVICS